MRKAVVEDTRFVRARGVSLYKERRRGGCQAGARLFITMDEFNAVATLSVIGLQNYWILQFASPANLLKRTEPLIGYLTYNQFGFRGKLRTAGHQFAQRCDFGFAHDASGE